MISLSPKIWELSQFIFGANDAKYAHFRHASGIERLAPSKRRVLDFGCATGNMVPAFIDTEYVGVDIDERLIKYARKKYADHENLVFVTSDEFAAQFEGVRWPVIILANTAHHLSDEDFFLVIRTIQDRLEPGGSICFIEPVITGNESQVLRFIMAMDQGHFHRTAGAYETYFKSLGLVVEFVDQEAAPGRFVPVPFGVTMRIRASAS